LLATVTLVVEAVEIVVVASVDVPVAKSVLVVIPPVVDALFNVVCPVTIREVAVVDPVVEVAEVRVSTVA
jgi:hypothetical protein